MNRKREKGFTLVELIVVIAIVAILASVAIVGYTQFISNARDSKAQAELDQVYNVLYANVVATPYEEGVENGLKVSVSGGVLVFENATPENVEAWLESYETDDAGYLFEGTLTIKKEGGEKGLVFVPKAGGSGSRDIGKFSTTLSDDIEIKLPKDD